MTDQEQIERIRSGHPKALESIYKEYRQPFLEWIRSRLKLDHAWHLDIFQDAVIAFYLNIQSGAKRDDSCSLKTYLFAIGWRKALDRLEKENRLVTFGLDEQTISLQMADDLEMTEQDELDENREMVQKHLGKMEPDCRRVLELFYLHGMDMESIAAEMGYKNANVAKKKKSLCLKRLVAMVKAGMVVVWMM